MTAAPPRLIAVSLALLLLAGCTPDRVPPPAAAAAPPPAADGHFGVIVAERTLRPNGPAMGDVRAAILATLGARAAAAGGPVPGVPVLEFIVRDDTGQTLSVVQDNPQLLRPGERVAIGGVPRTKLLRVSDGTKLASGG